ncbi:MAG TPA: FAD/NAD(P)-binding protein [Pyrinomonadaceae bacterium]|nr:FAD/NAD(P)-binding protein [Pyrinomonadaceae bacterium]
MENEKRITIIGGGASGTLLAINLLRQSGDRKLAVDLIEKRESVGRGVAYSTADDCHLLNVPAAKMGAFPDDVEHFHRWLVENGFDYSPASFVPRKIFGDYLSSQLAIAVREKTPAASFEAWPDEAVDIDANGNTGQVKLGSGETLSSDRVILAFGNSLPPHPSVDDLGFADAPKYFRDPWSPSVRDLVAPDDSVFIIGTGLSMVDFAMRFHRSGHRGQIYAISTRGLLPAVHKLGSTYPSFADEIRSMTRITDVLKSVRGHIENAANDGSDWRAVIDVLRPNTQEIWLNLPVAEKRYFMQHLSRYWNVARHRMPAEAAAVIDELKASGQLTVMKGRLRSIDARSGRFDIAFHTEGVLANIQADAVINCIGSESNFERLESPLVKNLISRGLIRNDSLSLGLDATPDGRLIGKTGEPSDVLLTLGTALKGVLWESTAIPEIRSQAKALAESLLADLHQTRTVN